MLTKIKKSFFSKLESPTHYIFSCLGLKIKTKHFYKEINNTIKTYWNCSIDKTELIKIALFCKDSFYLWRTIHPGTWLIFISCLVEHNLLKDAEIILRRLIGFNMVKDCQIERYLLVSCFAKCIGVTTPLIEKSVYFYEELYKKEKLESFKNYLKGKTIAIVGGSPCELGKNRGKEIDSHDIVIRFNNYSQEKKYICDYGKKTNIWVRQSSKDVVNKKDLSIYDYVIWADDFTSFKVRSDDNLKIMEYYFKNYSSKLLSIESDYYKKLKKDSNILRPTSGAIILYFLKEVLGSLENVDAYGFAFLLNDVNDDKHFFDKLCKISQIHDFFQETPFLHDFYYSNKKI